jgi:hypothetical protein
MTAVVAKLAKQQQQRRRHAVLRCTALLRANALQRQSAKALSLQSGVNMNTVSSTFLSVLVLSIK